MTITPQINVTGFELATISTPEQTFAERDRLLTMARRGNTITTAEGADRAAAVLRELTEYRDAIDAAHEAAKAPVLKATRQIDGLKHDLVDDVVAEIDRLSRIVGTWNEEQKRLAAEERRKAWEREQEIIREANQKAAEEKQRLADEQKKLADDAAAEKKAAEDKKAAELAELKRKQDEATDAEEAARLEAEQKRIDDEFAELEKARLAKLEQDQQAARAASAKAAEQHVEKVETEIVSNRVNAAGLVPVKAEATSTRKTYEFEVTDITALFEANPMFVKMTPDKSAIKKALSILEPGKHIPGVRHWETFKASVKASLE